MEKEQSKEQKKGETKGNNPEKEGGSGVWIAVIVIIIIAIAAVYFFRNGAITGSSIFGGSKEGEVIKLGFMGPLTGEAASYGNSIKKGVELAYDDSGLSDRVEVIYEDSGCEGVTAVNAINKLITTDQVIGIVGEVCSGATIPAAPIAEQNTVVLISAASTSPEITNLGDYMFRTVPSDAFQGDFAAEMIYNRGYRKLAVLYSQEDYGVGLSNVISDEFKNLGGEVIASEAFERGSTDLRTQITKIKEAKPDALYFISNSPDAAVAGLKQIKELGLQATLFASEGLRSDDTLKAGPAAEGLTVTYLSPGTEEFAQKHQTKYGEKPGPFAEQGYDAFTALAKAIEQGATTGEEIKTALYDIEFDGASGYINFDSNGEVTGTYDVYIVKNKEFVLTNR